MLDIVSLKDKWLLNVRKEILETHGCTTCTLIALPLKDASHCLVGVTS